MQFNIAAALCAALLTAVAEGRIAFTTLPGSVTAGKPVRLSWEGSDGTPVTITLKQGEPNNLKTVALITGSASGNSYTWTPSTSLPSGKNYALQISQDDTDVNYSGLFSISGGSSRSSSSPSSGSGSSASASETSSSASASSSSGSGSVPGVSAAVSGSSSNNTATTTTAPQGNTPVPSAGVTGGSASRNTTLSRATLTSKTSNSRSSRTSEATTTTGDESGSSATPSGGASSAGAAVTIASNFGLLLAGFAAVVYLG